MNSKYVHGYAEKEKERLHDQANILNQLLHHDTRFPESHFVLEAGCGVGAQTEILCRNNPGIQLTSVDISNESLEQARNRCHLQGYNQVNFKQADIYSLPFSDDSFHHVFVCFVLEHLHNVSQALAELRRVLKPHGTITVIEGDHGSALFYPHSDFAQQTINCLINLQHAEGGNTLIGRELYPLLAENDFKEIKVSPRQVYADGSLPHIQDGFTLKTFTAMVEGVKEKAIEQGLMDLDTWEKGIRDLKRTFLPNGVFSYTFYKATATI